MTTTAEAPRAADPKAIVRPGLAFAAGLMFAVACVSPSVSHSAGMPAEDRWDSRHISALPAEVRAALSRFARRCGPLAAEHQFSRWISGGGVEFLALHFEHLRCGSGIGLCDASGCLHEVFASRGGQFKMIYRKQVREIELKIIQGKPAVAEVEGRSRPELLFWKRERSGENDAWSTSSEGKATSRRSRRD